MLAHLRHTHLRRTSCSSWPAAIRSRRLASASVVHEEEVEENDDTRGSRGDEGVGSKDPKYGVWLETEGKKYEQPYRPRNWLGGEVPFPLNRSFKPPTPLSDQLRTIIYNEYMSNPAVYTVRKLSERHSISLKRVDAILRLKGLEEHWKKVKGSYWYPICP
ncbi:hypothetical protein AcW1_001220 [Taiwanofungus camphoratus]|nr:hypothetical protein AcV7_001236 [Antrodia cinnamomea]KAI0964390.1 hypothetical protein AcW1_001220 [Antrodia cinnamomea]